MLKLWCSSHSYTVAFDFDTSEPCKIAIHYFVKEDPISLAPHALIESVVPKGSTASFGCEVGQTFDQREYSSTGFLDLSKLQEGQLLQNPDITGEFPLVVHMETIPAEGIFE